MKRHQISVAILLANGICLLGCTDMPADADPEPSQAAPEEGAGAASGSENESADDDKDWIDLLSNGLEKWTIAPRADALSSRTWSVSNGVLSCEGTQHGWLISKEVYSDFEIDFEFRLPERGDSGLHFYYSGNGSIAKSGYEVQLIDDDTHQGFDLTRPGLLPQQRTGAIYQRHAPLPSNLNSAGK